jgi:transposase
VRGSISGSEQVLTCGWFCLSHSSSETLQLFRQRPQRPIEPHILPNARDAPRAPPRAGLALPTAQQVLLHGVEGRPQIARGIRRSSCSQQLARANRGVVWIPQGQLRWRKRFTLEPFERRFTHRPNTLGDVKDRLNCVPDSIIQPIPRRYPSDLSDAEWRIVQPLIPRVANPGPRAAHDKRIILNAIFYIVRGGNSWRTLPHDFPKWQSVYHYFRLWRIDGTWERLHTALREQTRVKS